MKIGFVLFPQVTQLDFTGPLQFLGRMPGAEIEVIAKDIGPLSTDGALTVLPSHTFDTAAPHLDMICVPGGFGITAAIADDETLDFVRQKSRDADYVTSVCTGALMLGAAGLLKGKRATTHWAYTDLLAICGAKYENARVVRDGNTFTGGGVTAGIDFALTIISALKGEQTARAFQLGFEYDPAPLFESGHPDRATPETVATVKPLYADQVDKTAAALRAALQTS
jgi:cyclohexyl-isocyanide hydratase